MESVLEKIKQFTHDQYANDNRLNARMQIYRFGENETDFHHWIFDKLDFSDVKNVLELGCGNGALWQKNLQKIPKGLSILLTDISEGMVDAARNALGEKEYQFQFKAIDASHTHFDDAAFQMILANHMLYHVDDKPRIFSEIERLLSVNGAAYASTLSMQNFTEVKELIAGVTGELHYDNEIIRGFNLENGEEVLSGHFNVAEKYIYHNDVIIKNTEPLLLYLASIYEGKQLDIYREKFVEFGSYVESIIGETGEIRITNKAALFKFGKN